MIAWATLSSSCESIRLTGDRRASHSVNSSSRRLRIYCFTFVAPQRLSDEDMFPRRVDMLPGEVLEWGRVSQLHSQFEKCDGHGIYSNETNEAYNVQGIDPAIAGMPLSGALLRYTGSATTYLTIWGSIIKTPALRDGFDWYVMLDSDSYVQPDRVRDILSDPHFDTGLWQVGTDQEWAVNAAMLREISNQWSWLNDRYRTGQNAGCPKWLMDYSGEHYYGPYGPKYEVNDRKYGEWVHCAQDMMQRNMPSAMNEHLPEGGMVHMGKKSKWLRHTHELCAGGDHNSETEEQCALRAFAEDCGGNTAIKQFCDIAIIHGEIGRAHV